MQDKKKVAILRAKFEQLLTSPKQTNNKMGKDTAMLIAKTWNDFCAEAKIDHFKMIPNRENAEKGPYSLKFELRKEEMVDKLKSSGFSSFEVKDGRMHDMINEQVDLVHKQLEVCNQAFADMYLKNQIDNKIGIANENVALDAFLLLVGLCVIAAGVAMMLTIGTIAPVLMASSILAVGVGVGLTVGNAVMLGKSVNNKNETINLIGEDINIKQVTTLLDEAKSMLNLADAFSKNIEAKKEPVIAR